MTRRSTSAVDPDRDDTVPRDRPGAVYLLPHRHRPRFKVGWSMQPLHRIQRLPEYIGQELDLAAAQVAWFAQAQRAHQIERVLHRGLAPFSVELDHGGDGHTEWFNTQGIVLARRMLSLVPADDVRERQTQLQALAEAPSAPRSSQLGPLPPGAGALDTWYRVEDLWLRLGAPLPLAIQADTGPGEDRHRRCLHWLGLRRLVEPAGLLLRSRAVNLETYRWHEAGHQRSLVSLMEWEQDDLLLHLMPAHQVTRWQEGDAVAGLMQSYLAQHAMPLRQIQGLFSGTADGSVTGGR